MGIVCCHRKGADEHCRTLEDYRDIFDADDLKHAPQIHEHEFNPFLLHDPKFQELHRYEAERGVERMRMSPFLYTVASVGLT